jgi:hypothetical protein
MTSPQGRAWYDTGGGLALPLHRREAARSLLSGTVRRTFFCRTQENYAKQSRARRDCILWRNEEKFRRREEKIGSHSVAAITTAVNWFLQHLLSRRLVLHHIRLEFSQSFLLHFCLSAREVPNGVLAQANFHRYSLHAPLLNQGLKVRSEPREVIG